MSLHLPRLRWMLALMAALAFSAVTAARAATSTQHSTSLLRVAFVSPTRGAGLFETATGSYPGRCVLYTRLTSNGGITFGSSGAPLGRARCGNGQTVGQIAFNSAGTLFAYGPGLEVSHDLGQSWTSPAVPGAVVALAASGRSTWLLTARCQRSHQICKLTLLASGDGGNSWRQLVAQPPDRAVATSAVGDGELGMSALLSVAPNGAVVLALPRPPRKPDAPSPPTATVESLQPDAGHWSEADVACDSGPFETELSIAPDGTRWLACASEPSTGVQPKSVSVSDRDGKNWRVVAQMCGLGTRCTQRMPLGGYLSGFVALSSSTAFYIGGRSALTGTFDGGVKWRTWQQIGGGATATLQVTFVDRDHGWAVAWDAYHGSSDLWRTQNGGRTWSRA